MYADRNLVSASWPKQSPELSERPDLHGLQPTGNEYRGFYLPPSIISIPGPFDVQRTNIYRDRAPEFGERPGLRGPQPA